MLPTRTIPQYGEDGEDWHRFLYKSSKGSAKAIDILMSADMAYMVALTGDPESPSTLNLEDYWVQLSNRFPARPPDESVAGMLDFGFKHGWFPHRFSVSNTPRHAAAAYKALWAQHRAVEWTALINDAALLCIESWSVDHYRKCIEQQDSANYGSREIVAGMLYLSLTWPSP